MATTVAAATLISLEEYMATSYRPDREYIDGEVRERNMGEWDHARIQALLTNWFGAHEPEWGVMVRHGMAHTGLRVPRPDSGCCAGSQRRTA